MNVHLNEIYYYYNIFVKNNNARHLIFIYQHFLIIRSHILCKTNDITNQKIK